MRPSAQISCENEFYLHENEKIISIWKADYWTLFDHWTLFLNKIQRSAFNMEMIFLNTEAPGNSKMAYLTLREWVAKFCGHCLYDRKLFNFKAGSPVWIDKNIVLKKNVLLFLRLIRLIPYFVMSLYSFGH